MCDSAIGWLQDWYLSQCNDDWEHQFGIKVETLDNPGWKIEIDLSETELSEASFAPQRIERSANDWISCKVVDDKFQAACGPRNLTETLELFRQWVSVQGFEQRKLRRLGG